MRCITSKYAPRFLVSLSNAVLHLFFWHVGFQGFAIDEVNSYLKFNDGDHKHRIYFDIFPTCPPSVLTVCLLEIICSFQITFWIWLHFFFQQGGSCVWNSDCMASDRDLEATACSAYNGYCLNNPTWKTARWARFAFCAITWNMWLNDHYLCISKLPGDALAHASTSCPTGLTAQEQHWIWILWASLERCIGETIIRVSLEGDPRI